VGQHRLNRLPATKVKIAPIGMHADGGGLYLQVQPGTGRDVHRSWIFRYATGAKTVSAAGKTRQVERQMGLGPIGLVSLSQARERALECRRLLHSGADPIEAQRNDRLKERVDTARGMTFQECAEAHIAAHEQAWGNDKHRQQWRNTLEAYAYPVLGKLPVAAIDTGLVLQVLEPIWNATPETASRVRARMERVLTWAKVREMRSGENPARWRGHLDQLLPRRSKVQKVKHHAALPYAELPGFLARLREREGIASLALEFAILTAARTGEVIGATSDEVNATDAVWTIAASRMKAGREHRVPLCDRALEIIQQLAPRRGRIPALFPGERGALGNRAMLSLLDRMKRTDLTVHGFRSTFRDWAAEQTAFPSEVVEMALAHTVANKVEAAYRRGDLFEKRRRLMDAWAEFCLRGQVASEVVALRA
jgi:integrase